MPRKLKVSREQALEAAMGVFWAKGYNATTVDELQAAMGIQRGSFYFNFTDKRALFFEVLEFYKKNVVQKRQEIVERSSSPKQGIHLFFKILVDHSSENKINSGCLNTNTATELGLCDAEIAERLGLGMESWKRFWQKMLDRAKAKGEVSKSLDAENTAKLLVAMTQGLNVVAKVNSDRKFLTGIVSAGLSVLEKN